MKYPITSINREMLDKEKVVDKRIHRILSGRLAQYNDNPKEAFAKPVYIDKECRIPIRTVRCFAKPAINTLVPLKKMIREILLLGSIRGTIIMLLFIEMKMASIRNEPLHFGKQWIAVR